MKNLPRLYLDMDGVLVNFEKQLEEARLDCGLKGNVEKHSRDMPGIVEYRFNQLQELEAILE